MLFSVFYLINLYLCYEKSLNISCIPFMTIESILLLPRYPYWSLWIPMPSQGCLKMINTNQSKSVACIIGLIFSSPVWRPCKTIAISWLPSVVVYNFSELISSDTTRPIITKLAMNVPWALLGRNWCGGFWSLEKMDAVVENRT